MSEPGSAPELWAGRYLLLWDLRRDGWSDVVVAEDIVLDRLVEIRLLAAHRADNPMRRARFAAAIHAAASVHHPGLVAVYDKGEHAGRPYMVCERAPGPTLGQILAAGERLTPPAAARIGVDLAEGLAAAHRAGVVHGAIEPNAIVVRPGGRAKLAYLGLGPGRDQGGDLADLARTIDLSLGDDPVAAGPAAHAVRQALSEVAYTRPSGPVDADTLARLLDQLPARADVEVQLGDLPTTRVPATPTMEPPTVSFPAAVTKPTAEFPTVDQSNPGGRLADRHTHRHRVRLLLQHLAPSCWPGTVGSVTIINRDRTAARHSATVTGPSGNAVAQPAVTTTTAPTTTTTTMPDAGGTPATPGPPRGAAGPDGPGGRSHPTDGPTGTAPGPAGSWRN